MRETRWAHVIKYCECSWYRWAASPGHACVTGLHTHIEACLSGCWVARWRRSSCSSRCPRSVWSEPRSAWNPWSLPGPPWEQRENPHYDTIKELTWWKTTDTKWQSTDFSMSAQITFILEINVTSVGDTMKTPASRNLTPFHRVIHSPPLISSCSKAKKAKTRENKSTSESIKSHG